jgi:hypothetical protein
MEYVFECLYEVGGEFKRVLMSCNYENVFTGSYNLIVKAGPGRILQILGNDDAQFDDQMWPYENQYILRKGNVAKFRQKIAA